MPIKDLADLREHLQTAVTLETATLAPYMCAMYSIRPDTNPAAYRLIRSVLLEEMLHLTLASNVMNAVGGTPRLTGEFAPTYPTTLPHSNEQLVIRLLPFTPECIEMFCGIETPAERGAAAQDQGYATIGQFYASIIEGVQRLSAELGEDAVFSGSPALQVPATMYYGGGGHVIEVTGLQDALAAMAVIVNQGEGLDHAVHYENKAWVRDPGESEATILDGDAIAFGEHAEVSHYHRFYEILKGRAYAPGQDKPGTEPTGPSLNVDWTAVWPMRAEPGTASLEAGTELWAASRRCDVAWSVLLETLETALNGKPETLVEGVKAMFKLRDRVTELMRVPMPGSETTVGPSFEWVAEGER